MTKVTFRKWKGEIIALFPDIPWNPHDYTTASYMHIGQHSSADYQYVVAHSRPATEPQYRDLLGYPDDMDSSCERCGEAELTETENQ